MKLKPLPPPDYLQGPPLTQTGAPRQTKYSRVKKNNHIGQIQMYLEQKKQAMMQLKLHHIELFSEQIKMVIENIF